MRVSKTDDVFLADKRLTAGQKIEMDTELLALCHDAVHFLIGQVVLVTIGAGPAALAVHIAGRGRVKQDEHGHIAVVFLPVRMDLLGAAEKHFVADIQHGGLEHMLVRLVDDAVDIVDPAAVWVVDLTADGVKALFVLVLLPEFCDEVDDVLIAESLTGVVFP